MSSTGTEQLRSPGRAVTLPLTGWGRDLAAQARAARAPLLAEFARRYGNRLDTTTDLLREAWSAMAEKQDAVRPR